MSACAVVNDELNEFFYAPTHSNFGLSDSWYPVTFGGGMIEWPYSGPQDRCISSMTEVPMSKYVPATGWILFRDLLEFLDKVWPDLKATNRLGQAFLNHFKDRFPEPWPELFYCEDMTKTQTLIHNVCR